MKYLSRRLLRVCALILACLQFQHAAVRGQTPDERPTITGVIIQHTGPAAVSDQLVRANIRVKEGDVYSPVGIDDDVKNLVATGYFQNVRVGEQRSAKGVVLTYVVQGKPVITEVRFSGNKKFSNSRLRKKVSSKEGEPLDEQKLFKDALEIETLYQKSGLQKTRVEGKPSINEALGKATLTFEIKESPKVRVQEVVFDGAKEVKQRKLRKAIKTRRWWWLSWVTGSGKLKDDQFEEDKDKLHDFYTERGYIDFELKDVKFDYPRTNRMVVRFQVEEGTRYRVSGVEFKGNDLYSQAEIVKNLYSRDGEKVKLGLQLKEGEYFTPKKLDKDVEAIKDFYGARGYIEAEIIPERVANIDKGALDLRYRIKEGDKFYVERIDIRGNTRTKDKVIRRELAITPGETFDMVRVKVSKNRLEQMQFFEKVDTQTEDTQIDNHKNLVINLNEKRTGNIAVGAGFSSIDSLVGFVEVSQGNFDLFAPPYFRGGGQKARLRIQAGTQRQDYVATFVEPWFLGRRLSFSTELYHRQLSYLSSAYDQRQTGVRLGLTKQLPFHITRNDAFVAGVTYTIEDIGLNFSQDYKGTYPNSVLLAEDGSRLVSRVGFSLAYDSRNSVIFPTRGQRIELAPEIAGGPLGGDDDYYRLELRVAQYWNPGRVFTETSFWQDFFEGHVLELTGKVGIIEAYGNGDRGDKGRVPLFDRDYLGGLYSLRGYKFRQVGPRDPISGEPIGGGTYWFGSAEYSVPIIERLRFAMFYDIGMVYPDAFSFSPQTFLLNGAKQDSGFYNDNWGIGLRLNLPIGPLRLDYGIPVTHDPRVSGSGRFQFGVGYTRDF